MKALIIYSNFAAAARANAALQHSVLNAGCAVQWNIIPWRADMLKFPPTSGEALADATDAHLLVFVGRCAESLPFWLQAWLEEWARCRQIGDVALAVIREESADNFSTSTATELSHFATRHGLNLIFDNNLAPASSKDRPSFTEGRLPERKPPTTSITPQFSDARVRNEYRDWGIND